MERNASRYALLGLLTLCPEGASGYDLRQLAGNSVGHFWSESYGQIYPVLKQLLREGLVTAREDRSNGKRDRTIYGLTGKGRKELSSWLDSAPREQPPRSEILLKLFFGADADHERMRVHVNDELEKQQKALARYEALQRELKQKYSSQPGLPYWLITLDCGLRRSRSIVEWCEATLQTLNRIATPARPKKGKARA